MSDPIVALVALDAATRNLTSRRVASSTWHAMMTANELRGPGWLLAYEAAVKGWLSDGHLAHDSDFAAMHKAAVSFYEVFSAPQGVPVKLPPAFGIGGGPASA